MNRSLLALAVAVSLTACESSAGPDLSGVFVCGLTDAGLEGWFNDVWVAARDDVYAVGVDVATRTGVVMHWDGSRWTRLYEVQNIELRGVWGSSPHDLHAVGNDWGTDNVGLLLDWNGEGWTETRVPWMLLFDVDGMSPTEVYAVGIDAEFEGPPIYAFDGTAWTRLGAVDTYPGLLAGIRPFESELLAVSGSSLVAFDGARWGSRELPPLREDHAIDWRALWGSTPDDLVLVGSEYIYTPGNFGTHGVILRQTASGWERQELEAHFRGVWGDGTEVVAVGSDGTVVRWDGDAWVHVNTPTDAVLWDVHGVSMEAVVAVGGHWSDYHGRYDAVALHCGR